MPVGRAFWYAQHFCNLLVFVAVNGVEVKYLPRHFGQFFQFQPNQFKGFAVKGRFGRLGEVSQGMFFHQSCPLPIILRLSEFVDDGVNDHRLHPFFQGLIGVETFQLQHDASETEVHHVHRVRFIAHVSEADPIERAEMRLVEDVLRSPVAADAFADELFLRQQCEFGQSR